MAKTGLIGPLKITGKGGGLQFTQANASTPTSTSVLELYRSGTDIYWWNGTTGSKLNGQGGGGGTGSLDDAYGYGRAITIDEGAISMTDATTGSANILEISKTGAGTGDAIWIDMDAGIAADAIYIDCGGGARTADDIRVKDDSTGNHSVINIDKEGAGASVAFDWTGSYNGSPAGQVFKLTFDNGDALDTEAMQIDTGTGNRGIMFDFNFGHGDASTTSHIWDIDVTGQLDSNVLDITYGTAASTGDAIKVTMGTNLAGSALVVAGTGNRSDHLIKVSSDDTGNKNLLDLTVSGTSSGGMAYFSADGAITGNIIDIDCNAAVAAVGIYIDAGNAIRTANLIGILHDGSGNVDVMQIDDSNTGTGSVFDINMTGATATGAVIDCDMDAAVARPFLSLDYGAGTRTEDVVQITFDGDGTAPFCDINITNTGAGGTSDFMDITVDSVYTGSILQVVYGTAAATGDTISIDMGTAVGASAIVLAAAGARTDDLIKIDDASTGNSHIFDINLSDAYTGNVFDVALGSTATGKILAFDMDAGVGATAIYLDAGAGTRTVDLIDVKFDGNGNVGILDATVTNTGSGNLIELDIDSVHTGQALLISYGTDAATGDAIDLTMGTNVAGRAIKVSSSATGTSGEGSAFDVTHDGNLAAGADVVNITSTGSPSSTSNLLAIEQSSGAGTAGAYGLYISCTGTNVEAIKVDDGNVVFDENLSVGGTLGVTGAVTLSSTLSAAATTVTTLKYKDFTEVVAAANVIAAGESGSVFFLNDATEFASTLPAPAAGLHFTFIVTGAPSGGSYTVTTNGAAAVIHGTSCSSDADGGASTNGTPVATITFVDGQSKVGDIVDVWCDGTYWYAQGTSKDKDAVTFS